MNNIKRELKEIIAYEAMYAVNNKQRFSLRFYKKHPNKLNARSWLTIVNTCTIR